MSAIKVPVQLVVSGAQALKQALGPLTDKAAATKLARQQQQAAACVVVLLELIDIGSALIESGLLASQRRAARLMACTLAAVFLKTAQQRSAPRRSCTSLLPGPMPVCPSMRNAEALCCFRRELSAMASCGP